MLFSFYEITGLSQQLYYRVRLSYFSSVQQEEQYLVYSIHTTKKFTEYLLYSKAAQTLVPHLGLYWDKKQAQFLMRQNGGEEENAGVISEG